MKNFIETTDSNGKNYLINVNSIAYIEDIDDKYKTLIHLAVHNSKGQHPIIESGHNYQELKDLIQKDQE